MKEDSFTLQQRIDSLLFQIKLKETEFNNFRTENATLKKQNAGLREEVKKTENEIGHKDSVIHGLKQQALHFKEQCAEYEKVVKEKKMLENKMHLYEKLELQLIRYVVSKYILIRAILFIFFIAV